MSDPVHTQAFEALKERVQLLEAVVNNFPGGLMLLDKNLKIVLCNDEQKRLLDYPPSLFERSDLTLEDLFRFNAERGEYGPGDIREQISMRMARAATPVPHVFERTRPNGRIVEVRGVPLPAGGFVVTYVDVTEQRRQQALIAHLAHHDPLTDLPNRVLLLDRLAQALARVRRGDTMALHYIDLDRFKPINDTHGHAVGDALLVEIAKCFRAATRETDTVARIGGDEFVVLQSGVRQTSDVEMLAGRLVKALARTHVVGDLRLELGASIGIAVAPLDGDAPDELLRKADEALYACKARGGNGFCFFAPAGARQEFAEAV
ncbi:MAG: diguanylate cyclase [Hyphomicrobiales bacterium]|nr:MAG: diguanylate cyclase [Hyphomicrobiales bacterium]